MTTAAISDDALDADIAILGRKGGGKTFTAKGIVEHLLDLRRRVLILDPLGVWAGLRTAADGVAPGYPIAIFGGRHGDLPLDPSAAVPMADIIARENLPAIIDISELSKSAQQSFLLAFLRELRRVNREALTVVLEEADVFAPQNPQGDDSKQLHGEIDWIARRGRFLGFRLISITQRPARLSKDVLTQANTLIIHRLPAPQDREAAKAWVDGNGDRDKSKQVFDTLASLSTGEAWVLAQDPPLLERMQFPLIKTLDTSATPKAGERRIEPKTLADVDVSAIRDALVAVVPEKAKKPTVIATDGAIVAAEQRGYERGWADGARSGAKAGWSAAVTSAKTIIDGMVEQPDDGMMERIGRNMLMKPPASVRAEVEARSGAVQAKKVLAKPLVTTSDARLSPTAAKILGVLEAVHPNTLTFKAAALRAGASPRSSQFRAYERELVSSGLVEKVDERLRALESRAWPGGQPHIDPVEILAQRMPPSQARMFQIIANARSALTRIEIATLADVSLTSSGLSGGLRELLAMQLIEKNGEGFVLSPDMREAQKETA